MILKKGDIFMSQYNKVTPELIEALKAAVPGRISVNGDINEDFSHDEMPIYGKAMPEVVAECLTTEEVAAVMPFTDWYRFWSRG